MRLPRTGLRLSAAGLSSIEIHRVEGIWRGAVGGEYFKATEGLHGYMPPYTALDQADRERVTVAIRRFIENGAFGRLSNFAPVLVGIGYRI